MIACQPVEGEEKSHVAEKPAGVMAWMMAATPVNGIVLDCFAGSGTTLEAAKRHGRRGIGIEIEERYCQIAASRLRQSVLEFKE